MCAVILLFASVASQVQAAARPAALFTVTQLTAPAGFSPRIQPAGINQGGEVTGTVDRTRGGFRVFVWTAGSGMRVLSLPRGAVSATARGINDRGLVAAEVLFHSTRKHPTESLPYVAVVGSGAAKWIALPGTAGLIGLAQAPALVIDDLNDVIGQECSKRHCYPERAIMWRFLGNQNGPFSAHSWQLLVNPLPKGAAGDGSLATSNGYEGGYIAKSARRGKIPYWQATVWNDQGSAGRYLATPIRSLKPGKTNPGKSQSQIASMISQRIPGGERIEESWQPVSPTGKVPSKSYLLGYSCVAGRCSEHWHVAYDQTANPVLSAIIPGVLGAVAWPGGSKGDYVTGIGTATSPICSGGCVALFGAPGPALESGPAGRGVQGMVADVNSYIGNSALRFTFSPQINASGQIVASGMDKKVPITAVLAPS